MAIVFGNGKEALKECLLLFQIPQICNKDGNIYRLDLRPFWQYRADYFFLFSFS